MCIIRGIACVHCTAADLSAASKAICAKGKKGNKPFGFAKHFNFHSKIYTVRKLRKPRQNANHCNMLLGALHVFERCW